MQPAAKHVLGVSSERSPVCVLAGQLSLRISEQDPDLRLRVQAGCAEIAGRIFARQRFADDFNRRAIIHKWQSQLCGVAREGGRVKGVLDWRIPGAVERLSTSFAANQAAFRIRQRTAGSCGSAAAVGSCWHVHRSGIVSAGRQAIYQSLPNHFSVGCKLVMEGERRPVSLRQVKIAVGVNTSAEIKIRSGKVIQVAI